MATTNQENQTQLRQLAELMLAVAGESVTVMKRNAPERALKLKRHDEWGIYLEFLKVMFNLTDRLSALHLPIKEQPQFMDSLEDAVTLQLKNVLEPAFGSGADQTEIMLTVGAAVAESRETYERYRFLSSRKQSREGGDVEKFRRTSRRRNGDRRKRTSILRRNALRERRDSRHQGNLGRRRATSRRGQCRRHRDRYNVRTTTLRSDTWASRSDGDRNQVGERDGNRRRRRSGNSVGTAPAIPTRSSPRGCPTTQQTDEPSCKNPWRTVCLRGILRRVDILA